MLPDSLPISHTRLGARKSGLHYWTESGDCQHRDARVTTEYYLDGLECSIGFTWLYREAIPFCAYQHAEQK